MSFHPITVNAQTFNQAGEGRYMLSTWQFGSPANYFRFSGSNTNPKTGITTSTVSRVIEKDVVVNGGTKRVACTAQLIISTNQGVTPAEIDSLTSDISEFISVSTLNRMLTGEV